jgi:ubiquinone/menaquinone biosynthesis C-methylase UbiE
MDYDAELQSHTKPLLQACAVRKNDRVLDIGCGTGQTTRDAARLAIQGDALGIDIVERAIDRARALAAAERMQNVRFEYGDAQVQEFGPRRFDLAMSRYGTMFFADTIAAFRNIRKALAPGGRLVMMVWQAHENNEWSVAVHQALAEHFSSDPGDQQHFSLADPTLVRRILETAGFAVVKIDEAREPVYYGRDVDEALQWAQGFRFVQDTLKKIDAKAGAAILGNLRAMLAKHVDKHGVWFGAREWIVTAEIP